jgi:hypothetical protein
MALYYDRRAASGRAPTPGANPCARRWSHAVLPSAKVADGRRTRITEASIPPQLWKHILHSEVVQDLR